MSEETDGIKGTAKGDESTSVVRLGVVLDLGTFVAYEGERGAYCSLLRSTAPRGSDGRWR